MTKQANQCFGMLLLASAWGVGLPAFAAVASHTCGKQSGIVTHACSMFACTWLASITS
jgi:hypothetical protein